MIGAYNKKAYKLFIYIKLLMMAMVLGIASIVCLASNNEENINNSNLSQIANNSTINNNDITICDNQ